MRRSDSSEKNAPRFIIIKIHSVSIVAAIENVPISRLAAQIDLFVSFPLQMLGGGYD